MRSNPIKFRGLLQSNFQASAFELNGDRFLVPKLSLKDFALARKHFMNSMCVSERKTEVKYPFYSSEDCGYRVKIFKLVTAYVRMRSNLVVVKGQYRFNT